MNGPDIIAEYNSNWSTLQQHYTHGPRMDEPLMRMQGSNFSAVDYYHADALGSVVMMTAPVNTQANPPSIPVNNINFYTAWGLRSSLAPTAIQPYTFAGREADAVGQIYMRNRYYAPRFGRFTQPDPKGFVDGVNTYAYVLNAPVNYVDPWGMKAAQLTNTLASAGNYISSSYDILEERVSSFTAQAENHLSEHVRVGWVASFDINKVMGATVDFGSAKLADAQDGYWTNTGYVQKYSEGRTLSSISVVGLLTVSAQNTTHDNGKTWDYGALRFEPGAIIEYLSGKSITIDVSCRCRNCIREYIYIW